MTDFVDSNVFVGAVSIRKNYLSIYRQCLHKRVVTSRTGRLLKGYTSDVNRTIKNRLNELPIKDMSDDYYMIAPTHTLGVCPPQLVWTKLLKRFRVLSADVLGSERMYFDVVEMQERAVPHMHDFLLIPKSDKRFDDLAGFIYFYNRYIVPIWLEVFSDYSPRLVGQYVVPIRTPMQYKDYFSKHQSKGMSVLQRKVIPRGWTGFKTWHMSKNLRLFLVPVIVKNYTCASATSLRRVMVRYELKKVSLKFKEIAGDRLNIMKLPSDNKYRRYFENLRDRHSYLKKALRPLDDFSKDSLHCFKSLLSSHQKEYYRKQYINSCRSKAFSLAVFDSSFLNLLQTQTSLEVY